MTKVPKSKPKKGAKMKPGQKQHIQPGVSVTVERNKMIDRANAGLNPRPYGNRPPARPHKVGEAPPKRKPRKTTAKKKK